MKQLARARREAQRLLREEDITTAKVPIKKIASKHAVVVERTLGHEVSGMLVPLPEPLDGKRWAIVVNQSHPQTRKRFTIAHELGHLLLHGFTTPHADREFIVRFRDARSSDGSVLEEIEANQFAAELLMPHDRLLERLRGENSFEYSPLDEN